MSGPSGVEAELEIRNALARLAQHADSGDLAAYLALLDHDIVWEMPANPAIGLAASVRRGHAEIAAGVEERTALGHQGEGSNTMHVVHSIAVDVESAGERATSASYFMYVVDTTSRPHIATIGRYHDTWRRVDGRWKLTHRRIRLG